MNEHKCLENIKKLYKYAGKYEDQQQYKDILEAATISTPEGLIYNSPIDVVTLGTMKKLSARNSLSQFLALLDIKQKTVVFYHWSF